MFQHLLAMERVEFQLNSSFRQKLTSLCADFLAWVETTRQLRIVDGVLPELSSGRVNAAMNYAQKTFGPALTKLLVAELQMNVLVQYSADLVVGGGAVPLFRNIHDLKQQGVGKTLYSGMGQHATVSFDPAIFDTYSRPLDLEASRFETRPDDFMMMLVLFPIGFLGEEAFGNAIPLTADEHAAVILHECGHGFGYHEHVSDLYLRADLAGNSVRYLAEKADTKTVLATADTIKRATKDARNVEWSKSFDAALAEIETHRDSLVGPGLALATAGIAGIFLCKRFWKIFSSRIEQINIDARYGVLNASSHKSSDTVVTRSNAGYNERIADEFVSRHGLGAALASALKKLDNMAADSYLQLDAIRAIRSHAVTRTVFEGYLAMRKVFAMLTDIDEGVYDPMLMRLEHILHNNLVVFKDAALSDEARAHFLTDTAALIETITTFKSTNRYKITQLFWGTIMRILSRGSVLDGLRTAGLSADYDILQRLSNGLVKNTLAYHASRIKSILTT